MSLLGELHANDQGAPSPDSFFSKKKGQIKERKKILCQVLSALSANYRFKHAFLAALPHLSNINGAYCRDETLYNPVNVGPIEEGYAFFVQKPYLPRRPTPHNEAPSLSLSLFEGKTEKEEQENDLTKRNSVSWRIVLLLLHLVLLVHVLLMLGGHMVLAGFPFLLPTVRRSAGHIPSKLVDFRRRWVAGVAGHARQG